MGGQYIGQLDQSVISLPGIIYPQPGRPQCGITLPDRKTDGNACAASLGVIHQNSSLVRGGDAADQCHSKTQAVTAVLHGQFPVLAGEYAASLILCDAAAIVP